MPEPDGLSFRAACGDDARAIAGPHADNWRWHYRGAISDAFLDGGAHGYLLAVWTKRMDAPDPMARTIPAEQDGQVVGPAQTVLDEDPTWGAFLDNLHVAH